MALTPAQLATLKTELQTDPRGYGYNASARNDSDMAARINVPRDGTNVPSNPTGDGGAANGVIKLNNRTVDTGLIRAAVTFDGYDGLVVASQSWFNWLTSGGNITVNAHLLQQLAGIPTATSSIWAAADRTAMNAAMEALMRKFGSRAEEKFGIGVVVTVTEVGNALNS